MTDIFGYFPTTMSKELLTLVNGKKLGEGIARQVYVFGPDPRLVIKYELASQSFQNICEWTTWRDFKDAPKVAKWLAPCKMISPCGTILLQERTSLIRREELPEKVPGWSIDTKIGNWGLLNGKPVMHDYGLTLETLSDRLKKADWWGFEDE
jgi:hypothetical protein